MSHATPLPLEPLPSLPRSFCPKSYHQVVRHIEQILNDCDDPVRFTPTGRKMLDQTTG